jgi:DNA-damage-inducible protein D
MSKSDNGPPTNVNKRFGLDIPFEEALQRFGRVTKEELAEAADDGDADNLVLEGQADLVPFRKIDIRRVFREGEWWFSIIDVIAALTETTNPNRYWSDLKRQMAEKEGFSEVYDEIVNLKMPAKDGKSYPTDAANPETLFRVIQSVRAPRAEAMKRWLARVAYERIKEIQDPEIAIKRAIMEYQLQGRSMDWIEQRIRSIMVRKELTAEWKKRGVDESHEFAILTNILSTRTFGVGIADHKKLKGIKPTHNLRDHMVDLELIFTMLGEKATKEIAQIRDSQGFDENKVAARTGGDIAGNARRELERETKRSVLSRRNFLPAKQNNLDGIDRS